MQPHLQRTKLCELPDDKLDARYVQQREQLRELVKQMARPKVSSALHGRRATFLERGQGSFSTQSARADIEGQEGAPVE